MDLPADAIIIETAVVVTHGGAVGCIRFKVPHQGGYDRAPYDDMIRPFDRESEANEWLSMKLERWRAAQAAVANDLQQG